MRGVASLFCVAPSARSLLKEEHRYARAYARAYLVAVLQA